MQPKYPIVVRMGDKKKENYIYKFQEALLNNNFS
jgi:hypothetical protein